MLWEKKSVLQGLDIDAEIGQAPTIQCRFMREISYQAPVIPAKAEMTAIFATLLR